MERIDTIFRCAHSVKGGAAYLGLADISDLMHQAESLLDQWRQKRAEPDARTTGLLRECVDLARGMPDGISAASVCDPIGRRPIALSGQRADPVRCAAAAVYSDHGPHRAEAVPAIAALFHDLDGLGKVLSQTGSDAAPWLLGVRCAVSDAE